MKKLLLLLAALTFFCGLVWYMFHTQIIIFSFPAFAEYSFQPVDKKKITLFWYNDHQKNEENADIIWTDQTNKNIAAVVSAWLSLMQEEQRIEKNVKLETVALTPARTEAFLSFSHTLFNRDYAIIKKWQILEGLFLTLNTLFPELSLAGLLVNDKPLFDEHIDCSASLPVASFLQAYSVAPTQTTHRSKPLILVIHPYGDKNKTGRVIAREFERKLTRQLALHIQEILETTGYCKVFVTHGIGALEDHEENATLANRLTADLYLDLNCFESKKIAPEIQGYFAAYNPVTDFWKKKYESVSLPTIGHAYLKNNGVSLQRTMALFNILNQQAGQKIFMHPPCGLPLRPLIGIETPSMIIECGIQKPEQISEIADLIAQALLQSLFS